MTEENNANAAPRSQFSSADYRERLMKFDAVVCEAMAVSQEIDNVLKAQR